MSYQRKILGIALLAAWCCFYAIPACAREMKTSEPSVFSDLRPLQAGDQAVSFWRTSWDFMNAAFPDHLWKQDDSAFYLGSFTNRHWDAGTEKDPAKIAAYQYFSPFITRSQYPVHAALGKWEKKALTVRIGWPWKPRPEESVRALFEKEAQTYFPALAQATGIVLSITDSQTPDIIIAPTQIRTPSGNVRTDRLTERHGIGNFDWWFEDFIRAGIAFAPNSEKTVHGVLLEDEKNVIQRAYCVIQDYLPAEVIEKLVGECLVRAMGLPGLSRGPTASFLSAENPQTSPGRFDRGMVADNTNLRKLEDDLEGSGGAISFYDFIMLRTLYCAGIRPGDDKNRVARFLVNEEGCLRNLFVKGE